MPPARLTYTYSSGSLPSYCIAFRPLNKGGQKINHQSCKEQLIDHDSYRFVVLYYTILASFASITPATAFSDYYHHTLIAITFAKPCHLSSVYSSISSVFPLLSYKSSFRKPYGLFQYFSTRLQNSQVRLFLTLLPSVSTVLPLSLDVPTTNRSASCLPGTASSLHRR